jgi:hypothetical protein
MKLEAILRDVVLALDSIMLYVLSMLSAATDCLTIPGYYDGM